MVWEHKNMPKGLFIYICHKASCMLRYYMVVRGLSQGCVWGITASGVVEYYKNLSNTDYNVKLLITVEMVQITKTYFYLGPHN